MVNNILIARLMGVNVVTLDEIRANRNPIFSNADGYTLEELKYHTSWDWLIPVIEEIDHLQEGAIQSIEEALYTRHLGDTYKAVVAFLLSTEHK
tara:strand:- start:325 stop:606 length:282 start_codon:yes stop_codon:yes gene_type:complete